ncbi:MAG: FliH/SctL family protein [bacterium]
MKEEEKLGIQTITVKNRIIKARPTDGFTCKNVKFGEFLIPGISPKGEVGRLQIKAEQLQAKVDDLSKEIEKIIAGIPRLKEEAHQKGLKNGNESGMQAGYQKAKAEMEMKIRVFQENIARIADQFAKDKNRIYVQSEKIVLEIALSIAQKILNRECRADSKTVLGVIQKAIRQVIDTDRLIIRVNPDDYSIVEKNKSFWSEVNARIEHLVIQEDDKVGRGGCLIESDSGNIDARVETQFGAVRQVIEQAWEEDLNGS